MTNRVRFAIYRWHKTETMRANWFE